MTPHELARFLKEKVPDIRISVYDHTPDRVNVGELLSALDAAVGLLREAELAIQLAKDMVQIARDYHLTDGNSLDDLQQLLATLRLVVGEKERSPNG